MLANIKIGKEAYYNAKDKKIYYADAYICGTQKKIHDNLGADITNDTLKAITMLLLDNPESNTQITLKNKGTFKLKLEKI